MDLDHCHHCGVKYSKRHLYRVDDKLKKNVTAFKNVFVNEKLEYIQPKFCRNCQKKWLNLETKRGENIEKYIEDMKKEIKFNVNKKVTLVDDEHLAVACPSVIQYNNTREQLIDIDIDVLDDTTFEKSPKYRKITVSHYFYDKEKDATDIVDNPETEIQNFLTLPGPSGTQSTINEHQITSASDDDKMKNSKDAIALPNNVKSIENENDEELGLDFEHWLNLWKEMFCSEGWEGSPECRLKYKYVMKKLEEAKKNGFAKEEIKDYNYWKELMLEKFYSDESDEWAAEEMQFIIQKMKETKQENK